MGFFYRFVADSLTQDFVTPEPGKLTPYSAVLVFSVALFLSNFVWNTWFMYRPVDGSTSTYREYLVNGTLKRHLIGIAGGLIFNTGFLCNLIASTRPDRRRAGTGSHDDRCGMGVFVFKEFSGAPPRSPGIWRSCSHVHNRSGTHRAAKL